MAGPQNIQGAEIFLALLRQGADLQTFRSGFKALRMESEVVTDLGRAAADEFFDHQGALIRVHIFILVKQKITAAFILTVTVHFNAHFRHELTVGLILLLAGDGPGHGVDRRIVEIMLKVALYFFDVININTGFFKGDEPEACFHRVFR